jgi:hypothetical protein
MNFRTDGTNAGVETGHFPTQEGVVEIPLLLPEWQAEVLENLAYARGLTAAEMVRRLLSAHLSRACADTRRV